MRGLFVLVALLVSCSGNSNNAAKGAQPVAEAARTKRIVASMMGEPTGFIARMNTTQISIPGVSVLEQLVNSCLSEETGDHHFQPVLSEAVPSLENGLWKLLP